MSDPEGRVGRRLRRILLLVPYAIHHPGVSVTELAAKFGVDAEEIRDDLQLLFMCGLPGYTPAELIDVDLQGDLVTVRMADYFGQPLRLTPVEALTLYAGGSAIAALPGMEHADALRRALQKLRRALGLGALGDDAAVDIELDAGGTGPMETLQRALGEGKRLRLEYMSASKGELTVRDVDPWSLVAALGRWYLIGLDHLTGEERMFRADRVKSARVLDDVSVVPDDFDPGAYRGGFRSRDDQTRMEIEISPDVSRWFSEYYPVSSTKELRGGWTRVEIPYASERWAATLVLRLGAGGRRVRPASIAEAARRLGAQMAQVHSD